MLGVRNGVLPNARIDAGDSAAGASSGTAVCASHATACKACVARVSRNCQIETDAKCMQSSNAVKAMGGAAVPSSKKNERGVKPSSLTKRLEPETATRPKIQPRLKHRGKDKPLAKACPHHHHGVRSCDEARQDRGPWRLANLLASPDRVGRVCFKDDSP